MLRPSAAQQGRRLPRQSPCPKRLRRSRPGRKGARRLSVSFLWPGARLCNARMTNTQGARALSTASRAGPKTSGKGSSCALGSCCRLPGRPLPQLFSLLDSSLLFFGRPRPPMAPILSMQVPAQGLYIVQGAPIFEYSLHRGLAKNWRPIEKRQQTINKKIARRRSKQRPAHRELSKETVERRMTKTNALKENNAQPKACKKFARKALQVCFVRRS